MEDSTSSGEGWDFPSQLYSRLLLLELQLFRSRRIGKSRRERSEIPADLPGCAWAYPVSSGGGGLGKDEGCKLTVVLDGLCPPWKCFGRTPLQSSAFFEADASKVMIVCDQSSMLLWVADDRFWLGLRRIKTCS